MSISRVTYSYMFVLLLLFISCSPKQSVIISESPTAKEKMVEKPVVGINDQVVSDIPVDDRVTTGQLPNGMKYFIQKNIKPENRAELRLAINAGSILEDEDQLGLAHFVEHMAFNGTENFEKSELVDYLESTGTRFGADLNAFTSFDETVYMLQVRTDSIELFDKGMLILKDWAMGVTFDHQEIDKERGVVESEWRSRLSADQRMQQQYLPVLYKGSRYAERLPIGKPEIIRTADYEAVKRFYSDWYRPDLMAVVVVGDVDVVQTEKDIKALFGGLSNPTDARERASYDVPRHPETYVSVVSDKEASFTNVRIVYKHDKVRTKSLTDYRQSMVRSLYNRMLGARLEEITKQPDPPFLFAFSGYSGDIGELDTYTSFGFVPEGKAAEALTTLLTENKRVLNYGFTAGELERAKKELMEGAEKNYKERDKTESANLAMRYVYRYLDNSPIPGPGQTLKLYEQYVPTIKLAETNKLAKMWIRDESRVVVITGPEKEEAPLPDETTVNSIIRRVGNLKLNAYQDDVIDQPFFDTPLKARRIVKTENFEDVGVDYLELSNGVEVYLKQTDFKNDEVLLSATSPGGSSLYENGVDFNASNSSAIVQEAGIGAFSQIQLDKLMAGKTVRVSPYVGTYSEGFGGVASPDDLEIMFQMIYKYFYQPRIDESAFTSYVTRQRGLYKNLMSNPQYFFSDYVGKLKYDNHPRVGFPEDSDWAGLNYDQAMDIYRERFADASDFTFSFVGNFDKQQLVEYCQKYLGNLPSIDREEDWKDVGIRAVTGGLSKRFGKGEAPKTNVHMYWHGDYEYTRQNNYVLSSMLAYLRIKMREALREDLGGVYGVGVGGGGSNKPVERYGITVSFNSDPPKTDTLVEAAKAVIADAIAIGPNSEDMVKVKETQRQSRTKDLKENRYWQQVISAKYEDDIDFSEMSQEAFDKKVNGLTADQIKVAVAEYFNYDNYIEIIMDPETKDKN